MKRPYMFAYLKVHHPKCLHTWKFIHKTYSYMLHAWWFFCLYCKRIRWLAWHHLQDILIIFFQDYDGCMTEKLWMANMLTHLGCTFRRKFWTTNVQMSTHFSFTFRRKSNYHSEEFVSSACSIQTYCTVQHRSLTISSSDLLYIKCYIHIPCSR